VSAAACVAVLLQPSIAWPESAWVAAMVGAALGVLGQAGDLLESWLKRIHGVKDSGNLLPGHGGVMDRMDGYVFVLPVYLLLVLCYAEFLP
jgi:phosphatidate cytidylyltransferase